eukprot:7353812-Pyramimonas_sp.AAC.1
MEVPRGTIQNGASTSQFLPRYQVSQERQGTLPVTLQAAFNRSYRKGVGVGEIHEDTNCAKTDV